ncbi:MAG: FtsX-like permease family protein, partial [Marinoscillum sp.]
IEEQYLKDERMAQMIQFFGLLAIFIASMGLFGLASFTVAKRRKEIGVRKVLGASARAIFISISQEFFLLVLVAFFIAIPIGYFLSAQWLQNFVFKIEIGAMIFIFSGVISLLIALIAVSAHTIEATLTNPVEALKNE